MFTVMSIFVSDYCIFFFLERPLETAEENACRLAQNPHLSLPYPECCDTKKDSLIECPQCDVSTKQNDFALTVGLGIIQCFNTLVW